MRVRVLAECIAVPSDLAIKAAHGRKCVPSLFDARYFGSVSETHQIAFDREIIQGDFQRSALAFQIESTFRSDRSKAVACLGIVNGDLSSIGNNQTVHVIERHAAGPTQSILAEHARKFSRRTNGAAVHLYVRGHSVGLVCAGEYGSSSGNTSFQSEFKQDL